MRSAVEIVDTAAAELFPGYFAVTMATGVVSIAAHLLRIYWISEPLLYLNALAYTAILVLTVIRIVRYPRRIWADMIDHSRGPGFFALVAGTCVMGAQLIAVAGIASVAWYLWWFAILAWLVVTYAFFIAVTTRGSKPGLETGINGAWLLAAVATQSIAMLGTLLPWPDATLGPALFFCLCMFLLGCMLYLAIIPLIFYRLTFVRVTVTSLTPPYWINMGAVAITTLAGSMLILAARRMELLAELLPFLKGFTLLFWAAATWWIPFLFGLGAWRHIIRRHTLAYEPQLWSMVFPLGMYTTGTLQLAHALELPFLVDIATAFMWVAIAAWAATAAGFAGRIWSVATAPA